MTDKNTKTTLQQEVQDNLTTPAFLMIKDDGIFVILAKAREPGIFQRFVDKLFADGNLFIDLDYDVFLKLLFDYDWQDELVKTQQEVKLAEAISRFADSRKQLYKDVKIKHGGKTAEYFFTPMELDTVDDNGQPVTVPATLNFDEFVSHLWCKNIKFGIDQEKVCQIMASRDSVRTAVASQREPGQSIDARIEEMRNVKSNDAPKVLENGRVDLNTRENHFPQATKDEPLLKKINRVLGKPGVTVTGLNINPKLPKDIELNRYVGKGTYWKQCEDGEYIFAGLDGFILYDEKAGKIAVTDKIENKSGVSTKTTGNLVLDVDEYVEHGEVQEKRLIEGKNLTFKSDVFGHVVTHQGDIKIRQNLSGGTATAIEGDIYVKGRISRAKILTEDGTLHAKYADTSTMVADTIKIDHAINCELIANHVIADKLEGCIVICRSLIAKYTSSHRDNDTRIFLLTPDASHFKQKKDELSQQINETQPQIDDKTKQRDQLLSDPEFAKFINLYHKVKRGDVQLKPEQEHSWRLLESKHQKLLKEYKQLADQYQELKSILTTAQQQLSQLKQEHDTLCQSISCKIKQASTDTDIQTLQDQEATLGFFSDMSGSKIREYLSHNQNPQKTISRSGYSIEWHYQKPKTNPDQAG